jgi:hypothetical protein
MYAQKNKYFIVVYETPNILFKNWKKIIPLDFEKYPVYPSGHRPLLSLIDWEKTLSIDLLFWYVWFLGILPNF